MTRTSRKRFAVLTLMTCLFILFASQTLNAAPQRGLSVTIHEGGAEETVSLYQRSFALVIGNDAYEDPAWVDLSNAVNDAEAVARELETRGFEVTFLKNLNSRDLKQRMEEFFILKGENPDARLFVWYAGHGHTIGDEGYLVPTDAPNPDDEHIGMFRLKSLALRRFGEFMRQSNARHVLAVFDSCFSGTVFSTARSKPPAVVSRAVTEKVRQFVSSGDANQTVSDDGQFRKLFLDAITGRDPRADANGDGYILGSELGLFLHQRMSNLTENKQIPRSGKINAYKLDLGDFVFQTPTSGATDLRNRQKPHAVQPTTGNEEFDARLAKLEALLKEKEQQSQASKILADPQKPNAVDVPSGESKKKWKTYQLGEVAVDMPAEWKVASRSRNREYRLKSSDDKLQLVMFWWFPDEPILGFTDIVTHKKKTVAGKTTTWIHSKFPQNQSLQVVFDEARADKRQFIITLEFGLENFDANSAFLDQILARVSYGGKETPNIATNKVASIGSSKVSATPVSNEFKPLYDQTGSFSIDQPVDWTSSFSDRDGMRVVTLKPQDKGALIVVVSKPAQANETMDKAFNEYDEIFFSDSFLPNSIDADDKNKIGSLRSRHLAFSGEIYSVEGVRLSFNTGKLQKFTGTSGGRAYNILVLSPDNASSALTSQLNKIMSSFRVGPDNSLASTGQTLTKKRPENAISTGNSIETSLANRFGSDCRKLDMSSWRHPTKDIMQRDGKMRLKWAMLCQDNVYPLFGVEFDFDPQAKTEDYFYPLYFQMLEANGMWPFSFVIPRDKLIINLSSNQQTGIKVDFENLN